MPGCHLTEPSIQCTPVVFQAGASKCGQQFTGKHAEAVFISAPTVEPAYNLTQSIRNARYEQGRDGSQIRIFGMFTIIVAETDEQAQHKLNAYIKYSSLEGAISLFSG